MRHLLSLSLLAACLNAAVTAEQQKQFAVEEEKLTWVRNSASAMSWIPGLGDVSSLAKPVASKPTSDEFTALSSQGGRLTQGEALAKGLRLIRTSEVRPPRWMTESDTTTLSRLGVPFMDITDATELEQAPDALTTLAQPALPLRLQHQKKVLGITSTLNTQLMSTALERFTAFRTRYYKSDTGRQSSEWLFGQISNVAQGADGNRLKVSVDYFKHKWAQSSIILRIESKSKPVSDETVIISAHQDSVNLWLPWFGVAPGADDDGSGTVTILEALRGLLASEDFNPDIPVEFHWYSGEEAGLLGSQDVAKAYQKAGRLIVGMMQMDMTGFYPKNEKVGIITDFTDPQLTDLLRNLVTEYTRLQPSDMRCGYACSDHASWTKAGYRAVMPFEDDDLEANPNIHTPNDVVSTIRFDHCLEFAKIAVGFAMELSHR
ncbi:hypothetical protein IWQ62_001798 [Dispira parvispora]|uniref:Peptide hydrolase n=1 Tax=Dispira parvispora TaxID=1520584 RepID=A0A9W8AU75_9FUNG|nr:hypothetical protein IWQ62_001798 [Dispira parvispora]